MSEKPNTKQDQTESSQQESSSQETVQEIEYDFKYVALGLLVIGGVLIGGLVVGISFIDTGLFNNSPTQDNGDTTTPPVNEEPPEEQVYEGYIEVIVYDESNLSEYPDNAVTITFNDNTYTTGETIPVEFTNRDESKFIEYTIEVNGETTIKSSEVTQGETTTIEVFI